VKRSSREYSDLEALEPTRDPAPIEQTARPTRAAPRSRTVGALTLLLAAALGSTLTIAIGYITRGSGRATVASTATSNTTVASNVVSRVRQPARLDGWTIVVESYRLTSVVEQQAAPAGHKWLVAELTVTNTGAPGRVFDSRRVVARYFESGAWPEVPSGWSTGLAAAPNQTLPLELAFSVPSSSQIYSIVVRKDLESEKQAGTAVEIDLNCC
jgi:hypothetical protein